MIYGFTLEYNPPEGTLRYIPPGCSHMLVYSDDAATFREEPYHGGHADDLGCPAFDKASKMGKYKLDLAVRAMFPRYRGAKPA